MKSNSINFTIFSSGNESSYFTKYQFEKHYNLQKIISSSQLLDSKIFLSLWINITYLIHHLNWFHFIDFGIVHFLTTVNFLSLRTSIYVYFSALKNASDRLIHFLKVIYIERLAVTLECIPYKQYFPTTVISRIP